MHYLARLLVLYDFIFCEHMKLELGKTANRYQPSRDQPYAKLSIRQRVFSLAEAAHGI